MCDKRLKLMNKGSFPCSCSLSFTHTQVYARTHATVPAGISDSLPLRADLPYSHISLVSPLCPSFLCLCLLEAPRCPGLLVRGGYRGLPALRGACFAALMSFSWLPVRAGPEPHRPARPEKKNPERMGLLFFFK